MAADYTDFTISFVRGDTHQFTFTVKNPATGLAQDVTGWLEFWVTAKLNVADADSAAVFQLTRTGGSIVFADPTTGVGQVTIVSANTSALAERKYSLFADIQAKDAGGNIWTLARGTFTVGTDITQSTS